MDETIPTPAPSAAEISVILPVYNGQQYLALALESLLAQTFTHWECILVNDCSTDGTADILNAYAAKDARFKVVHNTENLRLPRSLNAGHAAASPASKYFTWTSDDNLYHPAALATLHAALEAGADITYAHCQQINAAGNPIEKEAPAEVPPAAQLPNRNTVQACFMYTRAVFEGLGGYNPNRFLAEDYDFWLRAYLKGFQYVPINEILYDYRQHSGSLTAQRQLAIARGTRQMKQALLTRHCGLSPAQRHAAFLECARHARKIGSRKETLAATLAALKTNPRTILHKQTLAYLRYGVGL